MALCGARQIQFQLLSPTRKLILEALRTHLADFMDAYNVASRLKTLNGLTPYEYICKIWTSEPDRFILSPIHQMLGLNT